MRYEKYIDAVEKLFDQMKNDSAEQAAIEQAATIIAHSVMAGGIIQAFGGGHSRAGAIEVCGRAGGLIPTKIIAGETEGFLEKVPGNGAAWAKRMNLKSEDVVILISNSGNSPFAIELALHAQEVGAKTILVTSKVAARETITKHPSGKLLVDLADVVLDNYSEAGDAIMAVDALPVKIAPTSSITTATVLESVIYEAILMMVDEGYTPPIYMSANVEGGNEFNQRIEAQYAERIFYTY